MVYNGSGDKTLASSYTRGATTAKLSGSTSSTMTYEGGFTYSYVIQDFADFVTTKKKVVNGTQASLKLIQ